MEASQTQVLRPVASLSLRCNFSWTLAGKVVGAACQWGMVVVLAKLGSPEKVGRFALGYAVTAPVIMFANLHLRAVLATDAKNSRPFGDYLALRYVTSGIGILVIAAMAFASGYGMETALVVLAIGVAKSLEAMSDIYLGLLQQHERMDRIAKSGVIGGVLSLSAAAATFYFTRSVLYISVSLAIISALVLAFYDARSTRLVARMRSSEQISSVSATDVDLRPRWQFGPLWSLAGIALPLGIVMLLVSLNANIPRYFVERHLGEAQLGIFAAMAYPMMAGNLVISALAQSAIPRLARNYAAGDASAFGSLLLRLVGIGALIGALSVIVVAVGGKWVLRLMYGPEYAIHHSVFLWMSVAAAVSFVQWFLGDGMTAAQYFKVQPLLLGLVTLITVLVSLWLIPANGLMGAAMVLVIANVMLALGIACVDIHAIARLRSFDRRSQESRHGFP